MRSLHVGACVASTPGQNLVGGRQRTLTGRHQGSMQKKMPGTTVPKVQLRLISKGLDGIVMVGKGSVDLVETDECLYEWNVMATDRRGGALLSISIRAARLLKDRTCWPCRQVSSYKLNHSGPWATSWRYVVGGGTPRSGM